MTSPHPIYTAENCNIAYQLDWSLTLFWNAPPDTDAWLPALRAALASDGVRVLNHRVSHDDCSMFLLSTLPHVRPTDIARLVKGRLQHLVCASRPKAFQRNYDLRSIGSTKRDKVEAYVASQLVHHEITGRLGALFADLQIVNPEVDLSRPRFTSHARYWCNLHIALVHDGRRHETRGEIWESVRTMIRRTSAAKQHLLSRVGIVPDHIHMTLGFRPDEAPVDVALSYLNNIAYVRGMEPVFTHSCYVATFGEYDLGAVRRRGNARNERRPAEGPSQVRHRTIGRGSAEAAKPPGQARWRSGNAPGLGGFCRVVQKPLNHRGKPGGGVAIAGSIPSRSLSHRQKASA